jgi:hypothetical protein
MDDYPYATLGADGLLRCDELHHPSFPTLLRDVLHRFSHTGTLMYHGRPYREFGCGRCEVHVDIPAHPFDPGMTAWFTTATGDDHVCVLPQSYSDTNCDRTTSEMRGSSPKITSGDSRRSENAQTHTIKHTVPNIKFKLKLLQIKCHVL